MGGNDQCGLHLMAFNAHTNSSTIPTKTAYGPYTFTASEPPGYDDNPIRNVTNTFTVTSNTPGLDLSFGCGSNLTSPDGKAVFEEHPSVLIGFYIFNSLGYLILGFLVAGGPLLGYQKRTVDGGYAAKALLTIVQFIVKSLFINVFLLPFTELAAVTQEGVLFGVFDVLHAYIIEIMFYVAIACPFIALCCVKCDTSKLNPYAVAFLPAGLMSASYILLVISSATAQYSAIDAQVVEAKHTVGVAITFGFNNIVLSKSTPVQPSAINALSVAGLLGTILQFLAAFVPEDSQE